MVERQAERLNDRFPGSQPVSFDYHSLQLLETEELVI